MESSDTASKDDKLSLSMSHLALQAGDLLRELCHPLRVLCVPDPRHHDLPRHLGLEVGVLPLRLAHLLLQPVLVSAGSRSPGS